MTGDVDMTKMPLKPYKLLERRRSSWSGYDIAVVDQEDMVWGTVRSMVEVPMSAPDPFSFWVTFSHSLAHPDKMHFTPLSFTLVTASVLLAFMGRGTRVVIAGLGAGLTHTFLQRRMKLLGYDDYYLTSVEADQTVIDLARKYWQFDGDVSHKTIDQYLFEQPNNFIDVLYLNNFCQYLNHKATDVLEDYEQMDHVMSRVSENGVVLINCFNYTDPVDLEVYKRYAESRGYDIDVLNMADTKAKRDHYFILIGRSTVPPTPPDVTASTL